MVKIERLVFNSFQVNTFVLYDETGECVLVDPSCYTSEENNVLSSFISRQGLKPVLCINTHCHIDHVLGMNFIKDKWGIERVAHEKEEVLLKNAPFMGDIFGFKVDPIPPLDGHLSHEETVRFGNSSLKALHVPGHSGGSLAYYSEQGSFVLSGDALFEGSIGRTDLPGGDYDTLVKSIREQLFSLPENTLVWPGHGRYTTVGHEAVNNPFFK